MAAPVRAGAEGRQASVGIDKRRARVDIDERRAHAEAEERHGRLVEIQRARMLSATFEVACERGGGNVTVTHVVERSGVSRRTFYEVFSDTEECLAAAFDEALSHAATRVLPAWRSGERWLDRVRAGLEAFLSLLDEEPAVGRLLVVESLAAGPTLLERRTEALGRVIEVIGEGSGQGRSTRSTGEPPLLTAEGVVGGVLAIVHARLLDPAHGPTLALAGPLTSMIALPYLGPAAARRELRRPAQLAPGEGEPAHRARAHGGVVPLIDPFKAAGMRLTYRTVRVLTAIAAEPGVSNRTVGERADVKDPGQISKLLGRLERVGLISNSGLGPGQGAPNAWSLTAAGRRVLQGIGAHTARD